MVAHERAVILSEIRHGGSSSTVTGLTVSRGGSEMAHQAQIASALRFLPTCMDGLIESTCLFSSFSHMTSLHHPSFHQYRTASGQMLVPSLLVQIVCSRTGVPERAALTMMPGLT